MKAVSTDGSGVKRWRTSMLPKNIQPGTLGHTKTGSRLLKPYLTLESHSGGLSQDLRHDAAS